MFQSLILHNYIFDIGCYFLYVKICTFLDSGIRTRSMGSDLYFLIPFLLSTYVSRLSIKEVVLAYVLHCSHPLAIPAIQFIQAL